MDADMAKWIIGGMALAISAMAAYIVKLWRDRDEERKERLRRAEEKLALLELLQSEERGGGDTQTGGDS